MRICYLLLSVAVVLGAALPAPRAAAQGTRSDYERAANLGRLAGGKVFRDRVEPHWLPGNTRFWYKVTTGSDSHEFVLVDAETGSRQPAFDHARLAEALDAAGMKDVRTERLPVDRLEFDQDKNELAFHAGGRRRVISLDSYELKTDGEKNGESSEKTSQTGRLPKDLPRASSRNGAETEIRFVNRTQGEVELFWLDRQGQRQSYGKLAAGARRAQHTFAGHVWLIVDADGKPLTGFVAEEKPLDAQIGTPPADEPPAHQPPGPMPTPVPMAPVTAPRPFPADSPDKKWQASVKDHNVYLRDVEADEEHQLTDNGTEDDGYRDRIHWSPDSKHFIAVRHKRGGDREVYYVESSPKDQLQPKLHSYRYRKPGDPIPQDKPQLFEVAGRRQVPLDDALFDNPWSIRDFRWAADSSRFTFLYNQRGHRVLRIVAVAPKTGEVTALVNEEPETFVDYAHKVFVRYLDATGEILWMSERDGYNHLYLLDAKTGDVKHQTTKGEWVVRRVDRVDEETRQVWFRAGGIRPEQDPYYIHYCRVDFDGSNLVVLTEGDGTHEIDYSPDKQFFIDRYSRVDMPRVTELRRTDDGSLVCRLEEGDFSELLKTGWQVPERFVAKGRDGKTDIYGVIFRPTNFDPKKRYPVIEKIYAGPHGAHVPKSFRSHYKSQSMAELGFILVQIDGMGTSYRSKAFHDVAWKNLGDAGFPDRILWLKAAAEKYPSMDLTHVGIYGGSAGGQNALRALLAHGDFYHAAVADCGCHDNRMDKIWWNELWMSWPIGPHYEESSNIVHAKNLTGKLLLIVGENDRNVDPASTMQVVNALIKADKDFDLLVMTGVGHGSAETSYGTRRRRDFFVRHLLGVEPRQ